MQHECAGFHALKSSAAQFRFVFDRAKFQFLFHHGLPLNATAATIAAKITKTIPIAPSQSLKVGFSAIGFLLGLKGGYDHPRMLYAPIFIAARFATELRRSSSALLALDLPLTSQSVAFHRNALIE
jgi:hypothetical protein